MASGRVMIFMGDGYGKSAASLGIAMKRASEGDSIVIIQFLKGKGITDSPFTKRLEPEIKIFRFEKSEIDYMERTEEEQEEAAVNIRNGLNFARKVLTTGECNLLVLDEVLEVVNKKIISVDDLRELVEWEHAVQEFLIDCAPRGAGRKDGKMAVFKGSAVAIVTPFKETDESVNYEAFADIIDYQIDNGTDAIVVCGSTGEAATMSEQEHLDVCKFCIEHTKGRVPVIAGTGSNRTLTAIQLSKEVASYGADGLLLISPYYNKGTQDGVYKHFKMVADEVPGTPVILYNVPSRTGGNVLPQTVARLVKDVPNIVGIKEASGDISQIVKLMTLCDGNIDLYSGNDDQVVPLLSMGGLGVISVVANVAPKAMHDLCRKFFDGDVKSAAKLQMDTHELFEALFCEVNPIPVKKAVNLMGQNAGPLRMPLTEMTPANTERLRKAMQNFGLI